MAVVATEVAVEASPQEVVVASATEVAVVASATEVVVASAVVVAEATEVVVVAVVVLALVLVLRLPLSPIPDSQVSLFQEARMISFLPRTAPSVNPSTTKSVSAPR